jgi:hypothetical protein
MGQLELWFGGGRVWFGEIWWWWADAVGLGGVTRGWLGGVGR